MKESKLLKLARKLRWLADKSGNADLYKKAAALFLRLDMILSATQCLNKADHYSRKITEA